MGCCVSEEEVLKTVKVKPNVGSNVKVKHSENSAISSLET